MNFKKFCLLALSSLFIVSSTMQTIYADDLISVFPLEKYDQRVTTWINANDANYDKLLLNTQVQQQHQEKFFDHYFRDNSPWNDKYISKILHQTSPNDLKSVEQSILVWFNNQNKPVNQIGYGDNFHPYPQAWIDKITANINIAQFDNFTYSASNRAIAVDNLLVRVLPTNDVHFYDYKLAGQGYPFDNLQMTSVWAGTPLYILGETRDHVWSFVVTPDVVAWVKTKGVARVSNDFVTTWTNAARKNLAAITRTETSIIDEENEFLFSSYVGSVFPAEENSNEMKLMVPAKNAHHRASIKYAAVPKENASLMPLALTPHNMSNVMDAMIGRHYGWGNMYFNNDCSAELKSLFTPFGIWLPRHSSNQVTVSKMVDMTSASTPDRLAYLQKNGKPFLTLIYIGGHVILFVGNYPNPNSNEHEMIAMTYQNIWGLSPNPPSRRAVVGQAVLFPMLLQYPEDKNLVSLAGKKYFQVAYLDELINPLLHWQDHIDLNSMMHAEEGVMV